VLINNFVRLKGNLKQIIAAGIIGILLSSIPSTIYYRVTSQNILEPFLSIGLIFIDLSHFYLLILISAALHFLISLFWSMVLKFIIPNKKQLLFGMFTGIAIALIDLIIIGSHIPGIANLEFFPLLADHVLWGIIVTGIYSGKYFS